MLVNARRLIRKMRGGAQAQLIEADDGHFYVVKFRNNPQGRRVLVNEWIAGTLLEYLQITVPKRAIVRFSAEFLAEFSQICIQIGARQEPVEPGWHFGSRYPGHPSREAVYDFVPDSLLEKIGNIAEFACILAFDKWLGNADARQAVFIRARLREYAPAYADHPLRVGFIALMIDHGYIFNGPHWDYTDVPITGLYFRPAVYTAIRDLSSFQPWLDRIIEFPDIVIDDSLRELPPEWLNGDAGQLESLLETLMRRRRRVPDLIRESVSSRNSFFPNWAA